MDITVDALKRGISSTSKVSLYTLLRVTVNVSITIQHLQMCSTAYSHYGVTTVYRKIKHKIRVNLGETIVAVIS